MLKYPERDGIIAGSQIFLQNLMDCENTQKAQAVADLGGNVAEARAVDGIAGQIASVYLKMPHNSIRAAGKPLPFPSDLDITAAAA